MVWVHEMNMHARGARHFRLNENSDDTKEICLRLVSRFEMTYDNLGQPTPSA